MFHSSLKVAKESIAKSLQHYPDYERVKSVGAKNVGTGVRLIEVYRRINQSDPHVLVIQYVKRPDDTWSCAIT